MITIIGGGYAGLSAAYFLHRAGKRSAGGDVVADVANDDAEHLIFGLVLEGLQATPASKSFPFRLPSTVKSG